MYETSGHKGTRERQRKNKHAWPRARFSKEGRVREPGRGKSPEENLRNEGTPKQTVDIKYCFKSINIKERITLLK